MSLATKKQKKHSGLALILIDNNKSLASNIHHATSPHPSPSQSLKMYPDMCIQCLKRIRENEIKTQKKGLCVCVSTCVYMF